MPLTPPQKTAATWSAIAVLLSLALWLLAPVLTPFVVAAVLAYALTPLVDWIDGLARGRIPRLLAVIVVEFVFLLMVLSVLLLLVPILAKELPLVRDQLPVLADRINHSLSPWLAQFGIKVQLDVQSIKTFVLKYLNANVEETLGSVMSSLKIGGSVALAFIGNALLIPVALFFLLKDWQHFIDRLKTLVPPKMRERVDSFLADSDQVLGQYLRGQFLVMGMLSIYFSLALWAFGFELAVPVGVFTGLAFFIPYLGFGLGLLLALLAGILQFSGFYGVLVVAGVYGAGQLIESFYLTPRLVGERIGLHPLAVIFALLAFGQIFGFVGVLIALPTSAVLLVAIRRLRESYLASALYKG